MLFFDFFESVLILILLDNNNVPSQKLNKDKYYKQIRKENINYVEKSILGSHTVYSLIFYTSVRISVRPGRYKYLKECCKANSGFDKKGCDRKRYKIVVTTSSYSHIHGNTM